MANHENKVLELLQEIDTVSDELRDLYGKSTGRRSLLDQARINSLNAERRVLLDLAGVHSTMAVHQELQEISSRLDGPVRVSTSLDLTYAELAAAGGRAEHDVHACSLPETACLDMEPHGPHDWASLSHRWCCPGRS